jgi:hypothetical protein
MGLVAELQVMEVWVENCSYPSSEDRMWLYGDMAGYRAILQYGIMFALIVAGCIRAIKEKKEVKMCLNYLDEKIKVNKNYGWQVFKRKHGKLYSFYQESNDPVETNTWMKDNNSYWLPIGFKTIVDVYKTGYHLLLYKKDALEIKRKWEATTRVELKKVYFRKIVAKGYQFNSKTIVVKERYVAE